MQLTPNAVVADRFRLVRVLGKGGMGTVWIAQHLALDVPCAIKFIEGENATQPQALARFEREAKAAAQLRSPHVVQIYDHGIWNGVPYIAMELLEGEELGKRLERVHRLSTIEVNTIITQVSRALTKAHSLGIVHRDLKPDNIFLVRDDDREIAKVLDFGIAKANQNLVEGTTTRTGTLLGTPYYMSPEQAQGTKTVDARSDLWSLAVIVFQAVTGRLPFESDALGDLLVKIIVSPLPMPSQIVPDLPPGFDAWWTRASQRDPAKRFQTAREFAEALMIALGISQQLTDVMDGRQIRAALGSYGHAMPQSAVDAALVAQRQSYAQVGRPMSGGGADPSMAHGAMAHGAMAHGATGNPLTVTSQIPAQRKSTAARNVVLGAVGLLLVGGFAITATQLVGRDKPDAERGAARAPVQTASPPALPPVPVASEATVAAPPTATLAPTAKPAESAPPVATKPEAVVPPKKGTGGAQGGGQQKTGGAGGAGANTGGGQTGGAGQGGGTAGPAKCSLPPCLL